MGCNCAILPDELNKGKLIAQAPKTTALLGNLKGGFFMWYTFVFCFTEKKDEHSQPNP
jgi:hypothetical protein